MEEEKKEKKTCTIYPMEEGGVKQIQIHANTHKRERERKM
jgi:hypothetical protein